ncbi:MAG: hypothetical protein ACQETI_12815 [Halobacteriota archaeon]
MGIVALAGTLAFATGLVPLSDVNPGELGAGTPTPDRAAGTANAEGDGSGSDGTGATATATGSAPTEPFSFYVEDIEECGQTCRDVTVSLTNNQDEPERNVVVHTSIYAGNNTDESNLVWEGEETGSLDAKETMTMTERVELSYSDGFKITQNGGTVTVVTEIRSDDETVTFTERRDVT